MESAEGRLNGRISSTAAEIRAEASEFQSSIKATVEGNYKELKDGIVAVEKESKASVELLQKADEAQAKMFADFKTKEYDVLKSHANAEFAAYADDKRAQATINSSFERRMQNINDDIYYIKNDAGFITYSDAEQAYSRMFAQSVRDGDIVSEAWIEVWANTELDARIEAKVKGFWGGTGGTGIDIYNGEIVLNSPYTVAEGTLRVGSNLYVNGSLYVNGKEITGD